MSAPMPQLFSQSSTEMHTIEDARILVVDDERATVNLIRTALQHAGYRHVQGTDDPLSVIEAERGDLDLILLDLSMPVLDGFAFMEQLAAWDWPRGMPLIIVITAYQERQLRLRALQIGAIDFITKPIDLRELLLRVRNHLGNRLLQQRLAMSEARLSVMLQEAERGHRAKDLFLANISHELRTPLTAIIGFANNLAEDRRLLPEQTEAVDIVLRNVRHLHALVSDLLDISKLQVGHLHTERVETPLFQCLSGVVQLIRGEAARKGLRFQFHPIPPLPSHIETDPTRLRQILINLLNNAIKFTDAGEVYLFVSWDRDRCQLVMTVQDSGPGIPNDALPGIFDPFCQVDSSSGRQHGGSGLGLAIARGLAEQLGGTIEVTSHLGRGSVFIALVATGAISATTLIDTVEDWKCADGGASLDAPVPMLSGTVLFAEDTPDTQRLVRLYLERTGVNALLARNGEEAVALAQRHADIDLILMDMHMPDMDGLQATELLRLTGFDRPIVALTADISNRTRIAARAAGCDAVLAKPIDLAEFYPMLEHYLPLSDDTARTAAPIPDLAAARQALDALRLEFERTLPTRIAELRQALENGDRAGLQRLAHQLRGVGTSFGQAWITERAGTLEQLAETAGIPILDDCLRGLEENHPCSEHST